MPIKGSTAEYTPSSHGALTFINSSKVPLGRLHLSLRPSSLYISHSSSEDCGWRKRNTFIHFQRRLFTFWHWRQPASSIFKIQVSDSLKSCNTESSMEAAPCSWVVVYIELFSCSWTSWIKEPWPDGSLRVECYEQDNSGLDTKTEWLHQSAM